MQASPEVHAWLNALAQEMGVDRRALLQLLGSGGAAAVLMACNQVPVPSEAQELLGELSATTDTDQSPAQSPFFKDPEPFIKHSDTTLETRSEQMEGFITPNHLLFVRNNSVSLDVNADDWRLSIEGDAVASPQEITYRELRQMPGRTVVSYLECAGNQRAMFDLIKGQAADDTQWMTGAVGNGIWTGIPLRTVLELAGVSAEAASVLLIGMDTESPEKGWRRALPIEKALDPDTLLAYTLNGEDLPRDHGYPLRAMVPGWVGSASVKWLSHIVVSTEQFWTRNNTSSYVMIGDDYAPEGEALGKPLTTQSIKSALALRWPARLAEGSHRLHGYAHSPHGPIALVEWSADSGATWHEARVLEPQVQYSWARFEFDWDAAAGEHTLITRATDVEGNMQPDEIPFNEKGYLFNQPLPHPVHVA
ncbi:MAG: sulfite oxidase [Chloroflexota bacterium]|nr:sulfite oxidase [Chloroflexota bacterium]MDE2840503.1 sulfite oxidase [Chloroflexota bacterium]